ncbi:MAG: ABC transporter permease subunit [Thermoleophilia bacterium]
MPVRISDRIGYYGAWASGLFLTAVVFGIVAWLLVNGLKNIDWTFLTSNPAPGSVEIGVAGGILAPLIGTLIITAMGTLIALPLGLATAVFLGEYGKPRLLKQLTDTSIDLIFGVPSIVFALFGLAIFSNPAFIFLSSEVQTSGKATAKSFFCASIMMALIALPPIVRSTQAAITSVPNVQREAAYALGKTRFSMIRMVVLPSIRPGIATGTILGMGRIAGDTAIVWILLGGAVLEPPIPGWWEPQNILGFLHGTGATLTTYVYFASPAGEGNAEGKAYGAALVLFAIVFIVNIVLGRAGQRRIGKL